MHNLVKSTYEKWLVQKRYAANRCRRDFPQVAEQLDSCQMFKGSESMEELAALVFSPQGREFMLANGFPSLKAFRNFKPYHPEKQNIFIDAGEIAVDEPGACLLIGNTTATIKCAQTQGNTIILMHGAKAEVYASGYSVVRIEKDRTSQVKDYATEYAKILL